MTALVEAQGLTLAGRLRETSVVLRGGELTCLVGPNGSGKTSLMHALAGIGAPGGSVRIDGAALGAAGPARRPRLLTFLPATRELRWPLAALDLIRLGGATDDECAAVVRELDLEAVVARRVDQLSTGERSRVLIARALAPRPRLLLLDEPTANLDPLWQIRLMELLRAAVKASGRSALVAMHDLDNAARFGDRILVMQGGEIVADGPAGEIIDGAILAEVFGVRRRGGIWQPVVSPQEGPRSSP